MEGQWPSQERTCNRPIAQPVAICRGNLARVPLPRPFSVGGAVHDSVSDDDQHRPPPLFVPPQHHLKRRHPDDFIGSGVPSPSGAVRTPSDEISPLLGHGWGEEGFERPPPSALVNTFQRLGVSASDATQHEPKRLRASPWPRVDSPGNLSVDADLATRGSTSGMPSGLASPAMDEATRCEYVSEPWRRSPSDNERLSPVSQMLLCGRPGMLQRHLALSGAHHSAIPVRWESHTGTMGGGDGAVMGAAHGPLYRTAAATRAGTATPACCPASAGCCGASSIGERMSGVDEGEYCAEAAAVTATAAGLGDPHRGDPHRDPHREDPHRDPHREDPHREDPHRDPHSPPVLISPTASAPSWAPTASYRHGAVPSSPSAVPSSPSAVPSSPSSEHPPRPHPALLPMHPAALLAGMGEVPGALTPVPRRRLAARGSRASDSLLSVESRAVVSSIGGPFSQRLAEFHGSPTVPGPVPARHASLDGREPPQSRCNLGAISASLDGREPPPALAPPAFGLPNQVAARERAPRAGTPSPNRPTIFRSECISGFRSESISGFMGGSPNERSTQRDVSPLCSRASCSGLHVSARGERQPSHDREWTGDE
jgi:hypothetical protein